MACPKCQKPEFDPSSGLGISTRIDDEFVFICDDCGYPMARPECDDIMSRLARYEKDFHTVDFADLRGQIDTADKKLRAYRQVHDSDEHAEMRGRFVDAVAQAYATCRRMHYQLPEFAITNLTDQASAKLEEVGTIEVEDQELQAKLDKHRTDALRLIGKAREDMEDARQDGIRRRQRLKLLTNGCKNARIAMSKTLAYEKRQGADVDEATIAAESADLVQSAGADEAEHKYTKDELLKKSNTKAALIALAQAEFNLTLNDSMTRDQMADAIIEAQEKAEEPVAA